MKTPNTLQICGHTIKIEYRDGLVVGGDECWGVYDDDKHTIYLKIGMSETRKMEILLHECIHAIAEIHNLNLSEKAVKILAIALLALIRDNKIDFLGNYEKRNNSRRRTQRKRRN